MLLPFLKSIQPFTLGGVFLLIFLAEHVYPQRQDLIDNRHDVKNIAIGIANGILVFGLGLGYQYVLELAATHHLGLMYGLRIPYACSLLILFLLQDFIMYWWHRANHLIPFLWRWHHFHHIDKKLNSTSAIRFHLMELSLSYALRLPLYVVLGIGYEAMFLYGIIFTSNVVFHHSNIRLSLRTDLWLRILIVTPHMHRTHHSIKHKETDSNYSSVLSVWDRLFRSYNKMPDGEVVFGVPQPLHTAGGRHSQALEKPIAR